MEVNTYPRSKLHSRLVDLLFETLVPGPLFTKRTDVFPQDFVKSRSREIWIYTFPIALKIDRHLGSSTAAMPVKFQSDTNIITSNCVASRLHEILR